LEDEYTREGLALKVGYNLPAEAVSEVLRQVVAKRGAPGYIRSDNGPEFVARHLQEWLAETGIGTRYIAPGCPWRNGIEESFNGRLRDECLKVEVFYHAPRAQVVLAGWRRHYNEARPHSSLGYLTPLEYRLQYEEGVYKERRTLIFQVALKMGAGQIVTAVIFSLKK
jgi:transposase InsO family protein